VLASGAVVVQFASVLSSVGEVEVEAGVFSSELARPENCLISSFAVFKESWSSAFEFYDGLEICFYECEK
jgi:hypothetical protein